MKTDTSAPLTTHIQGEVTSLATCWKIKRTDDTVFTFTAHDKPLDIDIGDNDGVATYVPTSSFNRSAIKNSDNLSVDNLDLTGVLSATDVDEVELRIGLFDYATVWIFFVNHQDLTQGVLKMRKGFLGETIITRNGFFQAELRGLTQVYSQNFIELYSTECRADLGDSRCKVPIIGDILTRGKTVAVGEFYRVPLPPFPAGLFISGTTIVNPSFEDDVGGTPGGSITGWSSGNPGRWRVGTDPVSGGGTNSLEKFSGTGAIMSQQVDMRGDISDADLATGNVSVAISVWAKEDGNDQFFMGIEELNAAGGLVTDRARVGPVTVATYTQIVDSFGITGTVRQVLIELDVDGSGSTGDYDLVEMEYFNLNVILPISENLDLFKDLLYEVTVAGTTAGAQPTYDETIGNTTVDGTATLTARRAWTTEIEVTAVDSTDLRKKFTVTELTPNSGAGIDGKDQFPDDSMNGGLVMWATGSANAGKNMEVRDFVADDGITITQDIELFLDMPRDIVVGDTAHVYRGCFKRLIEDCKDIFDNAVNHRGEAYIPGKDKVFQYPDAKA